MSKKPRNRFLANLATFFEIIIDLLEDYDFKIY